MQEYMTQNGTKLFYSIDYDKGGYNYFNGLIEPRGYSLTIQRNPQEFGAFTDLLDPRGAVRVFLLEVGRKSAKQELNATNMAQEQLEQVAEQFGL